jgi:hypothetical protein
LPNPLLLNKKAKVVEQHGSFGRHFQGNIFQQFDLIDEETSMVRGTCDLEKDQVKNLNERNTNPNERNTNLKAQLDAMRKENEELKRPLLGPALSSASVRTEAQTMGTTKNCFIPTTVFGVCCLLLLFFKSSTSGHGRTVKLIVIVSSFAKLPFCFSFFFK